jgi:hypothetical protein
MSDKICSICFRDFTEYGNDAQPVNDGRCCDVCNWSIVIPARLRKARPVKANKPTEKEK